MACAVLPQGKPYEVNMSVRISGLLDLIGVVCFFGWARHELAAYHKSVLQQFERGVFRSDDSFSVDRLVASCQQRAMPALPGAGRILVPYFSSPEECVNETLSKGKGDSVK